jgi:transglutaminase-like putative cysteine protease
LEADEPLLPLITDDVPDVPRSTLTARITPADGSQKVVFSPALPVSVSLPTNAYFNRPSRSLVRLFVGERGVPYQVTAEKLVTWSATTPDGVSANQLRVAGREYPQTIIAQYAQRPAPGEVGPTAQLFLNDVKRTVGERPYDIAAEMEKRFRNPPFRYSGDVRAIDCGDLKLVECFMATKTGFCMYFATSMVTLLRQEGIPSRLVMGYLPGQQAGRTVTIRNDQAHAWVEVYFPGWGWVPFDPTADVARSRALPAGAPVAGASPRPRPSSLAELPDPRRPRTPEFGDPTQSVTTSPILYAAAGLGIAAAGIVAILAWRRRRRPPPDAAGAYNEVVGMASRLGFAPRPSQTIYEYAETLAVVVPVARADLMTVADARVETRYGGRSLGSERIAEVVAAAGRLRRSLLRLFLRRDRRRGVRRRR